MADITPVVRATDAVTISPGSGISITQSGSAGSYVYTIANTGGGGGAPTDAEYLVAAAHASLSAERVTTDTTTVSWDHAEAGKAKANLIDASVTDAKLRDSAALSVIGRATNTTGAPADIAAASDNHVLRRSGGALGFGTIDAASIGAGTIDTARLGSGTPDSTKFLRGDQTWAAPTGGSGLTYPQVLSAAWMLG